MSDTNCSCDNQSTPELNAGPKAPEIVQLVIEIKKGERNKYEFDKNMKRMVLDRVNGTALGYPADYGFVPGTLCEDGDPLDGLLIIDESVPQGVIVPARPIGVLYMVDGGEADEKLICVPADDISKDHILEVEDLGGHFKPMIEHFYSHYKDWKSNWNGAEVSFNGWGDSSAAFEVVRSSMNAAKNN